MGALGWPSHFGPRHPTPPLPRPRPRSLSRLLRLYRLAFCCSLTCFSQWLRCAAPCPPPQPQSLSAACLVLAAVRLAINQSISHAATTSRKHASYFPWSRTGRHSTRMWRCDAATALPLSLSSSAAPVHRFLPSNSHHLVSLRCLSGWLGIGYYFGVQVGWAGLGA
ncbi:hypothetical protein BKA80DRAFT_263418 [Phyllosticta citrichinensis]